MSPEAPIVPRRAQRRAAFVARRGFTLIEMMIVVAVIALLGAVALPAYQGSVRKARRVEVRAALTTAAQMLERYYTENNSYATATLGSGAGDVYPGSTEHGYYALTLPVKTSTAFTVQGAPVGAQAADACGTFTVTSAGVRDVTGGTLSAADCW